MNNLQHLLEGMSDAQREGALAALDAVSRPMTAREIENVLRAGRVTRSRATLLASTLKGWGVIAVIGPEHD